MPLNKMRKLIGAQMNLKHKCDANKEMNKKNKNGVRWMCEAKQNHLMCMEQLYLHLFTYHNCSLLGASLISFDSLGVLCRETMEKELQKHLDRGKQRKAKVSSATSSSSGVSTGPETNVVEPATSCPGDMGSFSHLSVQLFTFAHF